MESYRYLCVWNCTHNQLLSCTYFILHHFTFLIQKKTLKHLKSVDIRKQYCSVIFSAFHIFISSITWKGHFSLLTEYYIGIQLFVAPAELLSLTILILDTSLCSPDIVPPSLSSLPSVHLTNSSLEKLTNKITWAWFSLASGSSFVFALPWCVGFPCSVAQPLLVQTSACFHSQSEINSCLAKMFSIWND